MSTEIKAIDRSGWPPGPWDDEPDHIEWELPTGQRCVMLRNHLGAWCGYASVPKSHPWHGLYYTARIDGVNPDDRDHSADRPESLIEVHGGLTYSGERQPGVWFFGFDCAHACDTAPGFLVLNARLGDEGAYRDAEWVREQVNFLAMQLEREQTKQASATTEIANVD